MDKRRFWFWSGSLAQVLLLVITACGVAPSLSEPSNQVESVASVQIGLNDSQADVEAKYEGKVIIFKPEEGFAVLGFTRQQGRLTVLSTDPNIGAVSSPEVAAAGYSSWAGGWNAWAGGWNAWAGGWNAWSGGWNAWAGGGLTYTPMDNFGLWNNMDLPEAHMALAPKLGEGIVVGVIDTGVDTLHPVFTNRLVAGWDFVSNDNNPSEVPGGSDYGHGTAVAGIILQVAPKAKIMPIRVLGSDGVGDTDKVAQAISWAVDRGARVINLSLGSTLESSVLKTLIEYAASKGVYVVSSAGNEGQKDKVTFPARSALSGGPLGKYLISVGSVNSQDIKSGFSNYGNGLELVAPGENVFTLAPGNRVAYWSGTSFAAPFVTGAVGLALAEGTSASYAGDLSKYLGDFADQVQKLPGNSAFKKELGNGRLNLARFLRGVQLTDYTDSFRVVPGSEWDLNFAYKLGDVKLKIYSQTSSYNHNNIVASSLVLRGDAVGKELRPSEVKVNSDNLELVFKDLGPQFLQLFKDPNIQPGSTQFLTLVFKIGSGEAKGYAVPVKFKDSDELWINYDGDFSVLPQAEWERRFLTDSGDVDIKIYDVTGGYNHKQIDTSTVSLIGPGGNTKPYEVSIGGGDTKATFKKNVLWQLLGVDTAPVGSQYGLTLRFALKGGVVNDYPFTVVVK